MMPKIQNRAIPGDQSRDPAIVELLTYNERAGARKSINVGPSLLPLGDGAGGYTTDASTKRVLPSAGIQLYVYNNSSSVEAVTLGDTTMTAQAAGAVQTSGSPTAPFIGVPVPPNSYLYISSGIWNYVATNSSSLIVMIVDDPTYIITQPQTNSSDNLINTAPSGAPVNEPNT